MDAKHLCDYIVNTGEFYHIHVDMAKGKASIIEWRNRVFVGLSKYRIEFHEYHEGLSTSNIEKCTDMLKEYYEEHIKEL